MKKLIILLALIISVVSCKKDEDSKKVDTPNNTSVSSSRNVKTSINTTDNVTLTKKKKAYPAVVKTLQPFNAIDALEYVELEDLKLGMSLEELKGINIKANQNMEPSMKTYRTSQAPIYELTKSGFPMVDIFYDTNKVTQIAIKHKNATPPEMIGVGNTYGELLKVYPNAKAMGDTTEYQVTVTVDNIVFTLNSHHGINEVYDAPLTSRIKYLTIK